MRAVLKLLVKAICCGYCPVLEEIPCLDLLFHNKLLTMGLFSLGLIYEIDVGQLHLSNSKDVFNNDVQ